MYVQNKIKVLVQKCLGFQTYLNLSKIIEIWLSIGHFSVKMCNYFVIIWLYSNKTMLKVNSLNINTNIHNKILNKY